MIRLPSLGSCTGYDCSCCTVAAELDEALADARVEIERLKRVCGARGERGLMTGELDELEAYLGYSQSGPYALSNGHYAEQRDHVHLAAPGGFPTFCGITLIDDNSERVNEHVVAYDLCSINLDEPNWCKVCLFEMRTQDRVDEAVREAIKRERSNMTEMLKKLADATFAEIESGKYNAIYPTPDSQEIP